MNTVFGSLDKTKIPHGILLDYGMEFTNVPAYNGTLTDSTYSDKSSLNQIYNTLLSSRVREVSTAWITPTEYDNRWNGNRSIGVIALSGLYFKYAQFADNALTTNKIMLSNNKFYDKVINGVWQNPYQELQTFAMAAPIKQYDELTMQVKIPSNIFISNYQNLITSIQIDFDNGQGYVTVTYNQNITVNYTTYGTKIWKYKLNLSNGTALYNQSRMKIGKNQVNGQTGPPVPPPCQTCRISPTESPISITAAIPYLGGLGTVKLTIDYAGDPSQGLKRPLIVAEGFDLGVVLNPEKAYGNNTYSGTFQPSLLESGVELKNLLYEDYKQYDIVYVDWNNGVDYMQRNAYALEAVIKYVNDRKVLSGSTTKNVVLGQSMGGVIARYALADMEQRGENHQTSLFISHDAPQQGANIPISFQYMFRHLKSQYVKSPLLLYGGEVYLPMNTDTQPVSSYLSILDAPASKQLIGNFVNSNYAIDNWENTSFYDELKGKGLANSGGYPLQCRNIAISNGSECGTTQNFNPGDDLVNIQLNKGLSFWGDLFSLIYNPLGGYIGGTFVDSDLYGVAVLGLFPGHSKYNVDFKAKSLYDTSGNEIYKGRMSYTKKILWVLNVTVDITNVTKNQPLGILPFDTYGGGYFDTNTLAGTVNSPNLIIKDRFGFIPTASALDIGKRNITLIDEDYKKSYVGAIPLVSPKNSPFANFVTDFDIVNPNAHNKQHISFNPRNGKWLASELNALSNPYTNPELANCSFMCSGNSASQITGNDAVCGTSVFSVPSGADSYNWSITEGGYLANLTGNNTSTVTLTINNGSGYVTLQVIYGNAICGGITITKRIWVGAPQITGLICPNQSTICSGTFCQQELGLPSFDLTNNVEASVIGMTDLEIGEKTNWEWERINANIVIAQDTRGNEIYIAPNYIGQTGVRVRAKNNCGWSEWSELYFEVVDCSNNLMRLSEDEKTFLVYPNPSNEKVNIDLRDANNLPEKNAKISGELFDIMGKSKAKIQIKDNRASFFVSGLNKGVYVLKIYINGKIESHQIGVK